MAKHANCCVPGCTNNYRTKHGLSYYRIPKDKKLRRQYKILIRNATLKLDADNTRICGDHFEGGHKRSRLHLPSIFPWSKHASTRRVLKRVSPEKIVKKSRICKKIEDLHLLTKTIPKTLYRKVISVRRRMCCSPVIKVCKRIFMNKYKTKMNLCKLNVMKR